MLVARGQTGQPGYRNARNKIRRSQDTLPKPAGASLKPQKPKENLNPKPDTPNPKPHTLDPKPYTLNPKFKPKKP